MAILSILCGFIGLTGIFYCGKRILLFILQILLESIKLGYYSITYQYNTKNQIIILSIFLIISLILLLLAFIFGNISIKKGKQYKYYWIGFIGHILGWIGILILTISILTFIIYNILHIIFVITKITIISQNVFPLGIENLPMYNYGLVFISLIVSIGIVINILLLILIKKIKKIENKIDILV